jgi:hypothetical protein
MKNLGLKVDIVVNNIKNIQNYCSDIKVKEGLIFIFATKQK